MTTRQGRRGLRRPCVRGAFALLLAAPFLSGCMIASWPLERPMTSPFGVRWDGLMPGVHRGVDLQANEGTPIRAMASGRVRYAGWMDGFGNVVWITHRGDVLSVYAHLADIDVVAGAEISRGDLVGVSGSTGSVTGPHLHFEIWKNGRQIDPVQYLGGLP